MKVNILGTLVDSITKEEAAKKVEDFLDDGGQHYFVTPNPEIILAAEKDDEFREILNRADLSLPDGFGLLLASRWLKSPLRERITGVDFMLEICEIAEQKSYTVYLLGGGEGVAGEAVANLLKTYPRLKIVGVESGGEIDESRIMPARNASQTRLAMAGGNYELRIIEKIRDTKPDILFVALGAGKQEKWIAYNLKNMPYVKLAMGVGGAFDFIAGRVKRAPSLMRKFGLEWLYRLMIQPWRWKRIINATIKFSWEIIRRENNYGKQ